MTLRHLTISKIPGAVLAGCFVLALLLGGMTLPVSAQGPYCQDARIHAAVWSPDGTTLAVATNHGVLFYDSDLTLIRAVNAPYVAADPPTMTGPLWSPDGVWIILPGNSFPEVAARGRNISVIVNLQTGELRAVTWPSFFEGDYVVISEVVWSPDNRRILLLRVPFAGLFELGTELMVIRGIDDESGLFSPPTRVYKDLTLQNAGWETDTITVHADGIVLSIDPATLALREGAPELMPRWWVTSPDGQWQAAQRRDLWFVVREYGSEEERPVPIQPLVEYDEVLRIITAETIVWLPDSVCLIAIYSRTGGIFELHPELATILQGAVVDARDADVIGTFVLQAEGAISRYAVSPQGDRIVLVRDGAWLELWNPLTATRLATIEVPNLPVRESCWAASD